MGTRIGGGAAPVSPVIRSAYSGFTLNCKLGSRMSARGELRMSLARVSSQGGVTHTGSSVLCRRGG